LPLQPPIILIVDDEPSVLDVVEIVLRRADYRVLTASDARTALQRCESLSEPVDLLLTDITMPNVEGPQLTDLIRRRSPRTRVLYMTGHPTRSALARGLTEDDDILRKPFHPRELLQRVERALSPAAGTS
jgi:DNA-binding response OmpR family regulator